MSALRDVPKGWREGHGGDLACPHRDCSVCPSCAATTPEAVEVYGVHLWIPDPADRDALRAQMAAATP